MGIKIKPEKISEKVAEYVGQLEELKKVDYSLGQSKMYSIDAKVKYFLTVAFDDFKERNRDYQGFSSFVTGLTPEEEQRFYISDVEGRIRTLKAWDEEIKLIIETMKDSSKIDELKEQIEEKKLESARREKVAETKFYGAVIELLDLQRNILKDREENTKILITIQREIQELRDSINKILESGPKPPLQLRRS